MGAALFSEYEDLLARSPLMATSPLTAAERKQHFEAFLSVREWVRTYFLWLPNLADERDRFSGVGVSEARAGTWDVNSGLWKDTFQTAYYPNGREAGKVAAS